MKPGQLLHVSSMASRLHVDGVINRSDIQEMSTSSGVPFNDLVRAVQRLGYEYVAGAAAKQPTFVPPPEVAMPADGRDVELEAILRGSIFNLLRKPEEGENLDDMIVVTTYGLLRREREAIYQRLMNRTGGGDPPPVRFQHVREKGETR